MRENDFRVWLQNQGYDMGTVASRTSNCLRVCEYEGDLDSFYRIDKCSSLMSRLTYTTEDERENNLARHSVPIAGNIRNGTATLKQAVRLYVRFRNNDNTELIANVPNVLVYNTSIQQESTPKQIRDSYALFLDYFGIDKEAFYSYGLENTIFSELDVAREQWIETKRKLLTNQPLYIRSYGRQGKNTELFLKLYQFLFENFEIKEDPSNNTAPRKNLQLATGHRINATLNNYQCSHVFGHTKNPLLFESVWNICFTPKIFDPLTGHEATGVWPQEYQNRFRRMACTKYRAFIDDYNLFVKSSKIVEKIELFIHTFGMTYDKKLIEKFAADALSEWAHIDY